jgi:uncharacterized protein (TIGR02145 family)
MKSTPFFIFLLTLLICVSGCRKDEPQNETGTVTDSEGRIYKTVKIGEQWWMAENLNTGSLILSAEFPADNDTIEKYCFNDFEENCGKSGGLYTWSELMGYIETEGTRGICPEGWHIPSDPEVKKLEMELGMSSSQADEDNSWRGGKEGEKLKEGGSSGFEMKLSGAKRSDNFFINYSSYGYFFTSSLSSSGPWRRCVRSDSKQIGRYDSYPETYALSVRCVKN